jgi:type III restriction enzyme
VSGSFYEQPILNSPYAIPTLHHPLDEHGQPVDLPPVKGRRPSKFIVPVPKSRKRQAPAQGTLDLESYTDNALINEVRGYVDAWRSIPNPADWGVTAASQRLLDYWRNHDFSGVRPFFCQVEAVETMIWLTEVAPQRAATKKLIEQILQANREANPELFRVAMKMATGSGKTTVMAMLIAWQTVNAVRQPNSKNFSKAFLIIAPGITIRDRLRVLLPEDPDNYYVTRELVPPEMIGEVRKAEIVITNYHSFQHREVLQAPKVAKGLLQGNDPEPIRTTETDGEMLKRACGSLLSHRNVNVINDEAHHCYRHKVGGEEEKITIEEKEEAAENEKAARLWISGIEALKRKVGVRAVFDLSATPFFLRGSGYEEGTLFPWVVSDFSLMDAIECGIVKLPRVPVSDNLPNQQDVLYRHLWKHIGKSMPKTAAAAGKMSPFDLPNELQTALYALYSHYEKTFQLWQGESIGVPPVFIVVCQNTAISRLVFEWISGFEREVGEKGDERAAFHGGNLELFRNYDEHGGRLSKPRTLLIDSRQIESGDALDKNFRDMAGPEIEQFKRELAQRGGAGSVGDISDEDLLREVMNTVGREGRLGEQIRCVVSVSMLTEGWDTNTVTHILGVRAFGTQLLCEQVVGRGLRRQSYELNPETGLFDVEYADVMGIPFDFTGKPQVATPRPPKPITRVHAIKERSEQEIMFPRVTGYRRDLPEERLVAEFTEDSRLVITPEDIGATKVFMEGIVGEGVIITPEVLEGLRPSTISFNLAKHLLYTCFLDEDRIPKQHLFPQIQRIARRWIDEGYLVTKGVPTGAILYLNQLAKAAERIDRACNRGAGEDARIKAILDPYNRKGSTRFVNFITSKTCQVTGSKPPKCQISHVVLDSDWEGVMADVFESHPRVMAYAKNQGMGLEVPYLDGGISRRYVPDFVVRLDDGRDEPLNLILEVKGYRGEDAKAKADTMVSYWVPGVNALGEFGRWGFAEFSDWAVMDEDFAKLVDSLLVKEFA